MMQAFDHLAPPGSLRRRIARRWSRPVLRFLSPLRRGPLAANTIRKEERQLKLSWQRRPAENLDMYLVSGYQDPRINIQSILVRHFLIEQLFGSAFEELEHEELAAGVEMNESARARAAETGVRLGPSSDLARRQAIREVFVTIDDRADSFGTRWRTALEDRQADRIRVLEFACGSANDYRSWADYGIAPFLEYTGVDITANNIENAKRRFPAVNFRLDSVLSLKDPDHSFDYVIASDLFEHLSLEAMDVALGQAVRLARRGLALTFFLMDDIPEHVEVPRGRYHVNVLSAPLMQHWLEARYGIVRMVPISQRLSEMFGWTRSYNRRAWTILTEDPLQRPACLPVLLTVVA